MRNLIVCSRLCGRLLFFLKKKSSKKRLIEQVDSVCDISVFKFYAKEHCNSVDRLSKCPLTINRQSLNDKYFPGINRLSVILHSSAFYSSFPFAFHSIAIAGKGGINFKTQKYMQTSQNNLQERIDQLQEQAYHDFMIYLDQLFYEGYSTELIAKYNNEFQFQFNEYFENYYKSQLYVRQ